MTKRSILIIIILQASISCFGQTISNRLIGYWPFNGNANDESSNSNNATVVNASVTADRFGKKNSAYYFDGNGDYIDCGNDTSLFTSTHSCVFWFKYTNTSDLQWIVNDANSINGEWGFAYVFHPTGKIQGALGGGSNDAWISARTNQTYADNEWHMFASTYNATDNSFYIYIDGCFVTAKTHQRDGFTNGKDSLQHDGTDHLIFGAHSQYFSSSLNAGPRYYQGYLDDVHLYNRALDPCEIIDIYASQTIRDTVFVTDTNYVQIYDTTYITINDTVEIQKIFYDTSYVQIYDTIFVQIPIYDSVTVYDTTSILVTDTLRIRLNNSSTMCEIKVYPNPTDAKIIINSSSCDWTGYFLSIYNDIGQLIYKATLNPFNEIDLDLLGTNGFYYLEIKSPSDKIVAKRVVVLY